MDPDSSGGWRFAQCFGDKGEVEDITEADVISTVEFDSTGNYLATGDKGGRVVLFERNEQVRPPPFPHPSALPQADRISLLSRLLPFFPLVEEELRIQVLHRVSIT